MVYCHQLKTQRGNDSDSTLTLSSGGLWSNWAWISKLCILHENPFIEGLNEFMNMGAMQLWLPTCIAGCSINSLVLLHEVHSMSFESLKNDLVIYVFHITFFSCSIIHSCLGTAIHPFPFHSL
uniref:Uncharacterized protein n=1 Tax=Setaria viridis TaxID=4556 RepID=A0A4V6D511_SETVI|nr:hypothetical protein SEVIR_6G040000v2 [Setaria viridis]